MLVVNLRHINMYELGHTIQLTGMLLTDSQRNITYLVPLPDENISDDELKWLDMSHDQWKNLLRQTDIQEVEVLADDEGKFKKAVLRKSTRQIDQKVSWNVFRRDEYTCRYCGRDDVPLTVDHLVLWEEGGPSIEDNLVSSCKRCNKVRGNTQYSDWITSPKYIEISKDLEPYFKILNHDILSTLNDIPRKVHITTRTSSKDRQKKKRRGRRG